ncbi:unnamed protein product [Symbiodinium sp. CCMP2592]|nr:unnamed protein product [Symbiodinium sp. CCMP2592]
MMSKPTASASKPRARNTATDEQVKKILRSNLSNLGTAYKETDRPLPEGKAVGSEWVPGAHGHGCCAHHLVQLVARSLTHKETDMELIVAGYESFIVDFLKVSPRLVAKQLSRCAAKVFEKESPADVDMFARQVAYSLSYVRIKMKAVTSGKKTHPAIKRVCECLQKLDADELQQDRLSSLRKRVHSPDRSAGGMHMWKGCANIKAKASPGKRHKSQSSRDPRPSKTGTTSTSASTSADIYAMYGISRGAEEALSKTAPASPAISIASCNTIHSSDGQPAEDLETAPAEEASGSSWITLQYFCKASCKYITRMADGTEKRHAVFKGPEGFLKTKVFGKLKDLDVPNLFLQTFENAAGRGGISKIMKRPAAKKTAKKAPAKKAPASAGSASADGEAEEPEEPEEPELSTPPPKKPATPKSKSSPKPSPKSAANPSPKAAATQAGSPNRDSLMCASVHYIMASDRTYITGKFGPTKALLIEIHSRKSDKHRDLVKELFLEAERLHSTTPWGELRELMRNRREEVLQRQAE